MTSVNTTNGARISKALVLKLAASTMLVGSVLVSCSATSSAGRPQSLSSNAQKALQAGKPEKALASAEAAVTLDPRNADLRKTLAHAYLANGRFSSARQSFDDALTLGDQTPRTVISLALMHVAEGRPAAAAALLREHREIIPASDYGLAMALAGETKTGVEVLVDQIRGGENTAKVRQNLAFAYALDGRWREAQIMVGQDLDPKVAEGRIAEWARIAHPQAHVQRVASVLGVSPADYDAGQPTQLALANTSDMAQAVTDIGQRAMAEAAPVETVSGELAAVEDTTMVVAQVDLPPATPASDAEASIMMAQASDAPQPTQAATPRAILAPLVVAREIVQPLPGNYRAKPIRKTRPVQVASLAPVVEKASFERAVAASPAAPAAASAFKPTSGGAFAVQLGVFSSPANANRAWAGYSARHKDLAGFAKAAVATSVGGRTLHRLTANGFADEKSARAMCAKVRSGGGECIIARATPAKARGGTQVAARR